MTATSYVTLDNDDLGANKIFRAATASALDTNPVSIAQRGTGAPWLNGVGAIEAITSGSGNWAVPDGVYRIKVMVVGGGGADNANGNNSTFSSMTGGGGLATASGITDTGGTATGGDVNIAGGRGDVGISQNPYPTSIYINGGLSFAGGRVGRGGVGVFSSSSATYTGPGGGGTSIKAMAVEPGDLISYSVGAGKSGSTSGHDSTAGIIIIEY